MGWLRPAHTRPLADIETQTIEVTVMTEKTYPTRVDSSGSAYDCDDCAYYSAAAGGDVYCPECAAEEKAIWRLEMET